ncbi:MAG: sugar ABC transporter permease [Clostridiales bacterium]|nr:sugar ABC transporter permease [Clostridiales bacterium]
MKNKLKQFTPYMLLAPALIYYIMFWIRPVIKAVFESLTDLEGSLSIANYVEVFKEPVFAEAFGNSMIFAIVSVILQFVIAFMLALLLNKKFKGSNLLLFVALIPMAVPPTAIAVLWRTAFSSYGWLNNMMQKAGLIETPIQWLTVRGKSALSFLILIDTWTVLPSVMIILLAGLQNLNKEYEEAGYVFGASRWQVIKDITIPILKPTIVTAIILRMISAMQVWLIGVMMFGFGRVPFLVERIAYYSDVVPLLDNSYKMSVTYSVVVTVIVLVSAMIYLKLNSRGRKT